MGQASELRGWWERKWRDTLKDGANGTPIVAKRQSQVYNVISSYSKSKSMVAKQVLCPMEQSVDKGIQMLLAD